MKTDIEYAALARGKVYDAGMRRFWRPLEDDGDSRRLEIACLNALDRMMECRASIHDAFKNYEDVRIDVGLTDEQYRAAVFALAVAIGKQMENNDNEN